MAQSYFYYKRGEEWVRVRADSYSREYQSDPAAFEGGQCATAYSIFATVDVWYKGKILTVGQEENTGRRPITGPIVRVFIREDEKGILAQRSDGGFGSVGRFQEFGTTFRNLRNVRLVRVDAKPDNCGSLPSTGPCSTEFRLNNSVVLALNSCPEITDGRGCSECCRELLPIIRSLHI